MPRDLDNKGRKVGQILVAGKLHHGDKNLGIGKTLMPGPCQKSDAFLVVAVAHKHVRRIASPRALQEQPLRLNLL
ncbi:MAG: hypothetical protein ACI97A_003624 [Planctomycetota bacterium]|jgi:hypothetical protein